MSGNAFKLRAKCPPGTVPVNTAAPIISGTATIGQTLAVSTGTWSNSPTGYAYQWKRDGSNISGATSSTYVLVTADGGTTVSCVVTATNASGSASASATGVSVSAPSYDDGHTHASTGGSPLYPTLYDNNAATQLFGFAVPNRPVEQVPDVDYAIGCDAGSVTKTLPADSALLPGSVALDGRGWLEINGNTTLTGWDLKGYGLVNYGGYNVTLENCKWDNSNSDATFAIPFYRIYAPNTSNGNLTVRKCEIDCGFSPHGESYAIMVPDGDTVIELTRFKRACADFIDIASAGGCNSLKIRWNSMKDAGADWQAHGDFIQFFNGSIPQANWRNVEIYGNLAINGPANGSHQPGAANSFVRTGDLAGATVTLTIHHNYMIGAGFTHAGNAGGDPPTERDDYPGWINLIQGGGDAGIGYDQIFMTLTDNHFMAESGAWNTWDRTIYGIWSQGHWTNTVVTASNNKKNWDNSSWPTIP